MAFRILTVDFTINMTREDYERLAESVAGGIAGVPGLIRKTWIWNDEMGEAGGLYLFENQESLEGYLNGPIFAHLRQMREISNLRTRQFDVLQHASDATRGIDRSYTGAA